jgi:hypothetical protein
MTPKVPARGFPPAFIFILALVTIGVIASKLGVKESTSIITFALGGIAFAIRARQ